MYNNKQCKLKKSIFIDFHTCEASIFFGNGTMFNYREINDNEYRISKKNFSMKISKDDFNENFKILL